MTSSAKILIFQPGKVGSTAIKKSLDAIRLNLPVETAHVISPEGLRAAEQWYERIGVREQPDYMETGRRLGSEIRNSAINWKVITVFREPISRIISGFFQEAARIYPCEFPEHGEWPYEKVESFLLHEFLSVDPQWDFTARWFENELKPMFGIDVYVVPFQHRKGFMHLKNRRCELLVLQYEKLASAFSESIGPFLGIREPIPLLRANYSGQKPYAKIYAYTLENFKLPVAICHAYYSTRFAKHFYRPQDRQALIERWSR